jgi:peptidoglycan hydrolase-like protein with peptidoglycan-binding domain
VKNLQKVLKEVGKYNGKIDGIYNKSVIDTVYNFQIENGIPLGENNY